MNVEHIKCELGNCCGGHIDRLDLAGLCGYYISPVLAVAHSKKKKNNRKKGNTNITFPLRPGLLFATI